MFVFLGGMRLNDLLPSRACSVWHSVGRSSGGGSGRGRGRAVPRRAGHHVLLGARAGEGREHTRVTTLANNRCTQAPKITARAGKPGGLWLLHNLPSLPLHNLPSLPLHNLPSLPLRNLPSLPLRNLPSLPLPNLCPVAPRRTSKPPVEGPAYSPAHIGLSSDTCSASSSQLAVDSGALI